MNESETTREDADYLHRWRRRCEAIHRVQLSTLYHHKRERFFDSLDRIATATTLVTATAAAAAILKASSTSGGGQIELFFSFLAALAATLQVAFTPGAKAAMHGRLAGEMRRLWARFEQAGEEWTHQQCDTFTAAILELEAGESAQLGALVTQCENEIALATGRFKDIRELGFRRSLLKHWWNFDVTAIPLIKRQKVEAMRTHIDSQNPPPS